MAISLIARTPFSRINAKMRRTSIHGMGDIWSLMGGAGNVTLDCGR
jgi:hypothetical protein